MDRLSIWTNVVYLCKSVGASEQELIFFTVHVFFEGVIGWVKNICFLLTCYAQLRKLFCGFDTFGTCSRLPVCILTLNSYNEIPYLVILHIAVGWHMFRSGSSVIEWCWLIDVALCPKMCHPVLLLLKRCIVLVSLIFQSGDEFKKVVYVRLGW
jgi:hypothetical protein